MAPEDFGAERRKSVSAAGPEEVSVMGKVKSLKLAAGTRVGSYRIVGPLGRGWEGEVYAVQEVPTEAERAMKIIFRETIESTRHVTHVAWFFEQIATSRSVARYYHMSVVS